MTSWFEQELREEYINSIYRLPKTEFQEYVNRKSSSLTKQIVADHIKELNEGFSLRQTDTSVFYQKDFPGLELSSIDIIAEKNNLTIEADYRNKKINIKLSREDCNFMQAQASLKNGVLKISVPKIIPEKIKIQIEV